MVKDIQQATSVHNSIYSSSTSLWYFCTMFILNSNKCVPPVFYRSDEILYVHVDNIGEWISSWSREVSLPFMLSLSLSLLLMIELFYTAGFVQIQGHGVRLLKHCGIGVICQLRRSIDELKRYLIRIIGCFIVHICNFGEFPIVQ